MDERFLQELQSHFGFDVTYLFGNDFFSDEEDEQLIPPTNANLVPTPLVPQIRFPLALPPRIPEPIPEPTVTYERPLYPVTYANMSTRFLRPNFLKNDAHNFGGIRWVKAEPKEKFCIRSFLKNVHGPREYQKPCVLCVANGEVILKNHVLKNECNKIVCPILQQLVCRICGATRRQAHTIPHCPSFRADNPQLGACNCSYI